MKAHNKLINILGIILVFISLSLINNNSIAKSTDDTTKTKKMEMKHKMHHNMDMKMGMDGHQMKDTTRVIQEGVIDLKAIDSNKDGKVFQDQMHWNVISDKSGKCPLCKMTLQEVTLKEAKANLRENGFKVK